MSLAPYDDGMVDYEVDGDGPGLVLVHGTGGDADRTFGTFTPSFTGTRTVVRPNLSGSGKTTDGGGPLNLELFSRQVLAATRDAVTGGGPVDMLGFSLGAAVAVHLAAAHPAAVRRLVLVGCTAHTTSPRDVLAFDLWRALVHSDFELFKRLVTLQVFTPEVLDAFGHEALAASLRGDWPPGVDRQVDVSAGFDIRPLLARIRTPTLVVGFTDDQAMPVARARELHEGIGGSRFEELPGGHMNWTLAPDRVVELTREFLNAEPA